MRFKLYEGRRTVPHTKAEMGMSQNKPEPAVNKEADMPGTNIEEPGTEVTEVLAIIDIYNPMMEAIAVTAVPFVRDIDTGTITFDFERRDQSHLLSFADWQPALVSNKLSLSLTAACPQFKPKHVLFHLDWRDNSIRFSKDKKSSLYDLCIQIDVNDTLNGTLAEEHFYNSVSGAANMDNVLLAICKTLKAHYSRYMFNLADQRLQQQNNQ